MASSFSSWKVDCIFLEWFSTSAVSLEKQSLNVITAEKYSKISQCSTTKNPIIQNERAAFVYYWIYFRNLSPFSNLNAKK